MSLAAKLADLGDSEKDAKHLRDLAAKDEAPPTLLELLAKRQAQLDALQRQVAYLRQMTHTEQPILIEVRMVEASRSKLAEAGIKVSSYCIKPVKKSNEPAPAGDASTDVSASHGEHAGDYFKILDDLQLKRIAKIVASPGLITVSGRPAFFHSGGEFPYLQSRAGGDPSVEFKPWGVEVNLMAMSMSSEKIRLELKTRLGERDNASSVENHGTTIPGLSVCEWDVGLEMKSGETLVVGEVPQCGPAASRLSAVGDEPSDVSDAKEAADDMVTLLVVRATLMEPMAETGETLPGGVYGATGAKTRK